MLRFRAQVPLGLAAGSVESPAYAELRIAGGTPKHRRRKRGVTPIIARRGEEHGSGLGRVRWVVERTFAWLHNFRRLWIRYERSGALHTACLALGAAIICQRLLP